MSRIFTFLFLCFTSATALAQNGTLAGTVLESGSKPVVGASVRVTKSGGTPTGSYTNSNGKFTVPNLAPGNYTVVFTSVGFKKLEREAVITANETTQLNVSLEPETINFNDVVVTASRSQEKALEAPASITVVDPMAIAERPAMVPTEHLRGATGVDFAQTGISQQTTVTRGFNNVFSGMLLTLSDYRIAGVPSLRVNVPYFNPIVNDDIERMELVRGPGSALYGPNATQGVLNIITKSPFASQGTSVSIAGGERNLFNGTLRHAGTIGDDFGFKISGQYMRADDWQFIDQEEIIARDTAVARGALLDTLKIAKRDSVHERFSIDVRADYLITDDVKANFSTGISQTLRSVEMTGVGAAQAKDWSYYYVQGRVDYDKLFIQAFLNQSNAGNSYLLRDGAKIVDKSRLIVGRIQHSYDLSDMQSFTYGGDAFFTMPETEGTINGRFENDDDINEYGAYLQSETHLFENMLDVILTGRMDIHSRLEDPVFSPRAALVFKPDANNNIRFTFNRAYNTPSTSELFLDIVAKRNAFPFPDAINADVRASGVPVGGYIFDRSGGLKMRSHFSPDRNAAIPVSGASALWGAATEVVINAAPEAFKNLFEQLRDVPAPTPDDIGGIMKILNPTSGEFSPVTDVQDITQLRPTTNQTFEIGYKGIVADALRVGVDVYYSQVKDVIGSLQVFTPNVFFNPQQLDLFLRPRIKPQLVEFFKTQPGFTQEMAEAAAESAASQVIGGYAQIPLGTVTPQNASNPTDIMLAYRNAGNIDMMGTDISLEYAFGKMLGVTASYSLLRLLERDDYSDSATINGTYISKIDGQSDFALNAPEHKASVGVKFHEQELGLRAGIQYRYNDGFRMNSGVYIGHVRRSNLVDVTLGYDIPWVENLKLDISATNIFDNRVQYFVGAPEIGRLVMARLGYTF
jgi:iron complex outermembrane receptor protein